MSQPVRVIEAGQESTQGLTVKATKRSLQSALKAAQELQKETIGTVVIIHHAEPPRWQVAHT